MAAIFLLFFLDSWLVGSVAAIGSYLVDGPAGLHRWQVSWLMAPVWVIRQVLQPTTPEALAVRQIWLPAQLPIVYGLGVLGYRIYRAREGATYQNSSKGTHGTSRFMTPSEVKGFLTSGIGPGLIFGKLGRSWFHYPYRYPPTSRGDLNQFVIVYGGSGKGKTRGYILPNMLAETQASVIGTDPKGEVYAKTAAAMEAKGYQIWVVNFLDKRHGLRYNPLGYCRTAADVYRFVDTLISNTSNPEQAKSSDSFWKQAEEAYLAAITLYLITMRPEYERHLTSLLRIATRLPRNPEAMDGLFDGLPDDHPARASYDIFRLAEDRTRSGILIGAAVRLGLWAEPELAQMMAANDFDIRDLGRTKIALYLLIPDDHATYAPAISMLFSQSIQEMYDLAGREPGQRLPVPVRLRMDEAANIGRVPEFSRKVATMRGRGLSPEIVLQNHTQGRDLYGDAWESIEGNCDWQVFLGSNSYATAKMISEKMGIQTVLTETINQQGVSEGTTKRDVMTPDEVRRLRNEELLLFPSGQLPIRLQKIDYTEIPEWQNSEERSHHDYQPPSRGEIRITDVAALLP